MDIEGHGYIRRIAGVDVERQCFDLRSLAECKGFCLRGPVIVGGDGREFVCLFARVCSVQPWRDGVVTVAAVAVPGFAVLGCPSHRPYLTCCAHVTPRAVYDNEKRLTADRNDVFGQKA